VLRDKRIIITGAAGFIGYRLMELLSEQNDVTGLDIMPCEVVPPNAKFWQLGILNFSQTADVISAHDADIIIHCAAICGVDRILKQPFETLYINGVATAEMIIWHGLFKYKNPDRKFLVFSTSEVFGSSYRIGEENSFQIFNSAKGVRGLYASSKLFSEYAAAAASKQYGVKTAIIRPFNVYGPGQSPNGAMAIFIRNALRNEPMVIYGDGTRIRSWCYIDDCIDGIFRILSREEVKWQGDDFNIGNPNSTTTMYFLCKCIKETLKSDSKIVMDEDISQDIDIRSPDISKSTRLLDYYPKVSLEEGILLTAEWIRKYEKVYE